MTSSTCVIRSPLFYYSMTLAKEPCANFVTYNLGLPELNLFYADLVLKEQHLGGREGSLQTSLYDRTV